MLPNRQWLLGRRPIGNVSPADFELKEAEEPYRALASGQIRVRNILFLCAPTMRNWMGPPSNSLYPSIPLGAPVRGPAVGRVVESADDRFPVGSRVSAISSWQDVATIDAVALPVQLIPQGTTAIEALGVYGLNTLTAYFGLLRIGRPLPGETLVVSGAAGATGSVVAQIGKLRGCRVIGIAGSEAKCRWLIDKCGLDGAVDYRSQDVESQLRELAPLGINIFFDNVGGELLQAAIENMANHGRIVLCGQIAGYNRSEPSPGPRNMMRLIYGSIRMQGFLMGDFREQVPEALVELRRWVRDGLITVRTDVRTGFRELPTIFAELFSGGNDGALLVATDPAEATSLS